jgi:hypothetical protein
VLSGDAPCPSLTPNAMQHEIQMTEPSPPFPPAALRALAEAKERRAARAQDAALPTELGGRSGPEPVRYGDWERKGIAVDF